VYALTTNVFWNFWYQIACKTAGILQNGSAGKICVLVIKCIGKCIGISVDAPTRRKHNWYCRILQLAFRCMNEPSLLCRLCNCCSGFTLYHHVSTTCAVKLCYYKKKLFTLICSKLFIVLSYKWQPYAVTPWYSGSCKC